MLSFLTPLLGFLGGPVITGVISAYKAKLEDGNTTDRIAADLAARELTVQQAEVQAQNQLKVAEIGHWYEPDHLFAYCILFYFAKVYVWDAALHLGSTDAVSGDVATWAGMIMAFYFGKRGIENVVRIFKRK